MKPYVELHTNLDAVRGDVMRLNTDWPNGLIPRVGETVRLTKKKDVDGVVRDIHLDLRVVSVTYRQQKPMGVKVLIELHIPSYGGITISEWEKQFIEGHWNKVA
jgi:hypothetical protein